MVYLHTDSVLLAQAVRSALEGLGECDCTADQELESVLRFDFGMLSVKRANERASERANKPP